LFSEKEACDGNEFIPIVETLDGISISTKTPANALFPIAITPSGIVISVRFEHPENAFVPMSVTPEGME
jgi:hypothetical protein